MLLMKNLTLQIEKEKKRLNLTFASSFTRIAIGANENKTNSGFTKYFRQLKKELENKKEADDYIFVFTLKDWERNRSRIFEAKGKIIIIDNGGVILMADSEMVNFLEQEDALNNNQWIIKDFREEDDTILNGLLVNNEEGVAWLSEIKRHDYTEVRLAYKDKLTNLGSGKWLFTSPEAVQAYGLELLDEPRNIEYDGTDEFDVVNVSQWSTEDTLKYLHQKPLAKIYSDTLPASEVTELCTPVITNTKKIRGFVDLMKFNDLKVYDWEDTTLMKLFYKINEQTSIAKLLGPLHFKGCILGDSVLYLWHPKLQDSTEEALFATVALNPNLEYVTFDIAHGVDGNAPFSLRVAEKEGLTDGDIILILSSCMKEISRFIKMEGVQLWEMEVE